MRGRQQKKHSCAPLNDKGPNCGVRVPPPPWVLIWGEGEEVYTLLFDWGGGTNWISRFYRKEDLNKSEKLIK